ncbi:MAG: DsrE/DsrF/DrsH-like family protein [Trebonia sp.]
MSAKIEKVSIIISKGSLEGVYPGLIMANGARAEGMEAEPVLHLLRPRRRPQGAPRAHQARHRRQPRPAHGHPGRGLPGVSLAMTRYMNHKMEQLDIPSIPEFVEMIADTGAGLYACKASADLFGLTKADLIDQVKDIITVGEFYDMAAGGEIIFT